MGVFTMIDPEAPARPTSPAQQILGWVGLWLCSALFFPLLAVWTHYFIPRRPLHLPHPGSPPFWILIGVDVLIASLLTFSQWQGSRKPKKHRAMTAPATLKDRWRPLWVGGLLLGFLILRVLAASPGATIHWCGILGGAAALVLLFLLIGYCAKLTQPPRGDEEAEAEVSLPILPSAPPIPLGVRAPKNKYRAEVNAREVKYQRPRSERIGTGIFSLFFLGMFGAAVWVTLLSLELISEPGMHMRLNPAMALMMGGGSVFFLFTFLSLLTMTGLREQHVSPSDATYVYRLAAPIPWPTIANLMAGILGRLNRQEAGLPWHIIRYQGRLQEMAGVQRRETINESNKSYSVFLCWHDPSRPPMRVGFSAEEAKARAMQAQAAEDLGVPLLPDEVV